MGTAKSLKNVCNYYPFIK